MQCAERCWWREWDLNLDGVGEVNEVKLPGPILDSIREVPPPTESHADSPMRPRSSWPGPPVLLRVMREGQDRASARLRRQGAQEGLHDAMAQGL